MTDYSPQIVENVIRNYWSIQDTGLVEAQDILMDVDRGLQRLKDEDPNVYSTVMGVFAFGNSIQGQAKLDNITKMQVHRRLSMGLEFVTNIMNGVFV